MDNRTTLFLCVNSNDIFIHGYTSLVREREKATKPPIHRWAAQFVSFLFTRSKNGVNGPSCLCSFRLRAYYDGQNYFGHKVQVYPFMDAFSNVRSVIERNSFHWWRIVGSHHRSSGERKRFLPIIQRSVRFQNDEKWSSFLSIEQRCNCVKLDARCSPTMRTFVGRREYRWALHFFEIARSASWAHALGYPSCENPARRFGFISILYIGVPTCCVSSGI